MLKAEDAETPIISPFAVFPSHCVVCLLLILFAGCKVGPNYKPPESRVPKGFLGATTRPATTRPASIANEQPADVAAWWATFDDPMLQSLIARAAEQNLDVRQAAARVREARASRRAVGANLWPFLDTSASYRRAGGGGDGGESDLFNAGIDASWELDIFGGRRRDIEAANADVRAAVEDRRDVLITLLSEVALTYLDLRGFQRQIHIANDNLIAQRRSAGLTQRLFAGGFSSRLDVANATAQVASTESQIPLLEANVQQTIFTLGVLLGQEPTALLEELAGGGSIPPVPPAVPVGLPSDLLRRRPDIRRADAQLHAATARIGSATADLFPRFTLNGSVGYQGARPGNLFNAGNRNWSVGPGVSWPLFNAGQIRAEIAVQNARQEQALLAYRQAVLNALREVENALISYTKEQERRASLSDAVVANRQAVELSTQLYSNGRTDFLNVLSAQRSLLSSEDALVQSDRVLAQNLIALYKALGGGWEFEEQPPSAAATRPTPDSQGPQVPPASEDLPPATPPALATQPAAPPTR